MATNTTTLNTNDTLETLFDPANMQIGKIRETYNIKHWLNFVHPEYAAKSYQYELIKDHYYSTASSREHITKHIRTEALGEGDGTPFVQRIANSSRLYKGLFPRQVKELNGRIISDISKIKEDSETINEQGKLAQNEEFWLNGGGDLQSYSNAINEMVEKLIAFEEIWILGKPKIMLEKTLYSPTTIEIINPDEIVNWNLNFAVRRVPKIKPSTKPNVAAEMYVQYYVYYSDRVEHYTLNSKGKEILGPPDSFTPAVQYYYENKSHFTDIHNIPALPIFKSSLPTNYAFTMASLNSHLFDMNSLLYYNLIQVNSPRMAYDIKDKQGLTDTRIEEEVILAEAQNNYFIPTATASLLQGDPSAFTAMDMYMEKQERDFKEMFFIKASNRPKEATATEVDYEKEATSAISKIVIEKVEDTETRIYRVVSEFEYPQNKEQKQKVRVQYNIKALEENDPEKEESRNAFNADQVKKRNMRRAETNVI